MARKGALAAILVAGWLGTGALSVADEATKSETPAEYDFVQTAVSGTFKDGILTLNGIGDTTIYFGERPNREAGKLAHAEFVRAWGEGENSFAGDPPNASLVANDASQAHVAIVELTEPTLDGNAIRYHARLLGGTLPERIGPASLFIDPGRRKATGQKSTASAVVAAAVAAGSAALPIILQPAGNPAFSGSGNANKATGADIKNLMNGSSDR